MKHSVARYARRCIHVRPSERAGVLTRCQYYQNRWPSRPLNPCIAIESVCPRWPQIHDHEVRRCAMSHATRTYILTVGVNPRLGPKATSMQLHRINTTDPRHRPVIVTITRIPHLWSSKPDRPFCSPLDLTAVTYRRDHPRSEKAHQPLLLPLHPHWCLLVGDMHHHGG